MAAVGAVKWQLCNRITAYRMAHSMLHNRPRQHPNSIIKKKLIFFKTIIDFWKKIKLTSINSILV